MNRPAAACLLLLQMLAAGIAAAAQENPPAITVFAAASLTNVLQELGDGYTAKTSAAVRFSFASSAALARQIEQGSGADIFFSADLQWMDYLDKLGLLRAGSRRDVLGNRLVLIAPLDSAIRLKIKPGFALLAALGDGRLATGDPDTVPAGRYAQESLTNLGVWADVANRLVPADSVRAALVFVDRQEAPLGIVYETDALIDKGVRIVDVFPENTHRPIVYPVALTHSAQPEAAKFVVYLLGPAGELAFKHFGFTPLH